MFVSTNKTNDMNKEQLTNEIKRLSKEENISFLNACSAMQSAAAKMGSEKMIGVIAEIKMESKEYKKLWS